jgi:hypothetical protein
MVQAESEVKERMIDVSLLAFALILFFFLALFIYRHASQRFSSMERP